MAAKRCMLFFPSIASCLPICLTVCCPSQCACKQMYLLHVGILRAAWMPGCTQNDVHVPMRQKPCIITIKQATLCRADSQQYLSLAIMQLAQSLCAFFFCLTACSTA